MVETPDDAAVRMPAGRWPALPGARVGAAKAAVRLSAAAAATSSSTTAATWPWPSAIGSTPRQTGLLKTLADRNGRRTPTSISWSARSTSGAGTGDAWASAGSCKRPGIDRILWSRAAAPEQTPPLNALGVLTSRYDIYQDVMDPANFRKLRGIHPDWTTAAWPKDLMLDADGHWQRGWESRGQGRPLVSLRRALRPPGPGLRPASGSRRS